jgi:uncharacterized protein YraI
VYTGSLRRPPQVRAAGRVGNARWRGCTDGTSGFYALRVSNDVWPEQRSTSATLVCKSRRRFAVHVAAKRVYHPCTRRP